MSLGTSETRDMQQLTAPDQPQGVSLHPSGFLGVAVFAIPFIQTVDAWFVRLPHGRLHES